MHLFINALAASSSSGLTYLRNVIPHLCCRTDLHTTLAVNPQIRESVKSSPGLSFADVPCPGSALRRFWHEQFTLPEFVRNSGADVLISAGNFALRNSPIPQILLSGNSLYTSNDFYRDLRSRGAYGLWFETHSKAIIARRSLFWADCTVAPSEAFARVLRKQATANIVKIHHGFDAELFARDRSPLAPHIQRKLDGAADSLRLLFVSYYNYYRNFETLFKAVPFIREQMAAQYGRGVKLFLTCTLRSEENPGRFRAEGAKALVEKLGIGNDIVELGPVPYHQLHHVYRQCDIYVTASYAETFAHPTVEAMASGLPVVASDIEVHREICGSGATYFPRFSSEDLALHVLAAYSKAKKRDCNEQLRARAASFSWKNHVDELVSLAHSLRCSR